MSIAIGKWNTMIKSLIRTKKAWENFQDCLNQKNIDALDEPKAQRFLTLPFVKMVFAKALPLLISYASVNGGLDKMLLTFTQSKTKREI